ncbi:MAG: SH3 domain-containing protein [Clostridia bacterium]|nr:SH3 domain-containing protein [Clostridia bacterium]
MEKLRKYLSLFLCVVVFLTSMAINGTFNIWASTEPILMGTVKKVDPYLNVREGPGTSYNYAGKVYTGETVYIYEETNGWYKIACGSSYGYVSKDYIIDVKEIPKYDYDGDFETNLVKQNFPESYKVLLRELHVKHPNWIFMADHLTMTFTEAVNNESTAGKSLIQDSNAKDSWKSMMKDAYEWDTGKYVAYDSGGWVTAERDVVEYYMEPRNFLNENYIFMFLDQTYNPQIQNMDGLKLILKGTFMEGDFPEDTYDTYADVIMDAAKKSGVSPYVLAASIIIEQGVKGTGGSISGKVSGYEGYYNFFNIRAYKSGSYDAVQYGLLYAKGSGSLGRPWNTRAKSILGGAEHYANGYVKRGQDNLYYKKFNVIAPTFYINQYMTNVQGAYLETSKLKNAYANVNSDAALVFSIPVYKNTSETNTTALPTSSGANNYYITSLKVDSKAVEGFDLYKNEYEFIVENKVDKIKIEATVPSGAKLDGAGEVALKEGQNRLTLTVTAASGKKANYYLDVFREEGEGEPAPIPEPTIEGKYNMSTFVSGVAIGTDVATFIKTFNVKNGTAKVFGSTGSEKTSGVIATGDSVAVYDNEGTEKMKFSIVIYGDTNGDGKVSIIDLGRVQKHLLEVITFKGNEASAADVNHDGKISILDLARIQKHLLEITQIEQ